MKKNKTKKPGSITIMGRRWFDRINGNTYHSVRALVDGVEVYADPFSYGYGEMYEQNATAGLEKAGALPGLEHYKNTGGSERLRMYCDRNNIKLYRDCVDVSRKKDL